MRKRALELKVERPFTFMRSGFGRGLVEPSERLKWQHFGDWRKLACNAIWHMCHIVSELYVCSDHGVTYGLHDCCTTTCIQEYTWISRWNCRHRHVERVCVIKNIIKQITALGAQYLSFSAQATSHRTLQTSF
ncbi:hypothetical protein HETIRDRAFT_422996 [Heterobasidion irregulare TC 32-1]|uniref:Uncharacterized protein n=1 Tax=Heterobasidion irregulare (strain TC 32-1) TaxID=747525 RepID=W4JQD0_HETIT|nr:uncharacterized protein HETIRDRAFT_422996 [Heterobasidion irregulare TC 32-1]ETW75275.1 hypothetical protein HETIRDRAFT_422996 [Heterobasidion irregulare TC 32-1]